jgi:hypothetical protein
MAGSLHEKLPFFLGQEFALERDRRPIFKFSMKEDVLPTYRMISRVPNLLGWITAFAGIQIGWCFGDFVQYCLP